MIFKDKQNCHLKLFKALGDKTRLGIVLYLATGEKCVCNIFKHLNLPQNLISHHLGVLRQNKLIKSRKEGKWVHYSLNNECFRGLRIFIDKITKIKARALKC